MHIDARQLEAGHRVEGDICIIGAGAAGISIAVDWIGKGKKVLLLEGGGMDYDYAMQDLYRGESVGQRYYPMAASRLHQFGGTTGHWAGFCSDLDDIDFEERSWVPMSGWPFGKSELVPFYRRAQRILQLGPFEYESDYWMKHDPELVPLPFDPSRVWPKMWQFSPPTRFGVHYREDIVSADDVELYTNANVVRIGTDPQARTVSGVTTRDFDGSERTFIAKHYILACGAVQNARLLLCSDQVAPAGLGNDHDLVGRHFMEHLEVEPGSLHLGGDENMKLYLWTPGATPARAEWAIPGALQREKEILNCTVSFWPGVTEETRDRIDSFGDGSGSRNRDWSSIRRNRGPRPVVRDFTGRARLEQSPNPNSRVFLGEARDALGMRRLSLDWQLSELDKRSIRTTMQIMAEEVGRMGVGRVKMMDWLADPDDSSWPRFLGGGWHHMGTTRMDVDPKRGVVDADCRVHGVDNLFVAGSGAFATAGCVNPTLSLVALSLRLSDHVSGL